MFKRKKTIINGVELPEDFQASSIINNIAISNDGRYAAVTKKGDLIISEIPQNGKIEIDGTTLNYRKSTGKGGVYISECQVNKSIFSSGSIIVSNGGSYVSNADGGLEYEIDQDYDKVSAISVKEMSNNIKLRLSNDDKVYVQGDISQEPEYNQGNLRIKGLDGKVLLPKSDGNLEQNLETMSGNIKGEVAHKGRMKTLSGNISIQLFSPLRVETSTLSGDIDIRGMLADGKNRYLPPSGNPTGTLYLKTLSGDITVKYEG